MAKKNPDRRIYGEDDLSARLRGDLRRFERAVREHAVKGGRHPEDALRIERDYEKTKARLIEQLWIKENQIG